MNDNPTKGVFWEAEKGIAPMVDNTRISSTTSEESNLDAAIAAARTGDVERLRSWLEEGGNPNLYDSKGWTPLLAASVRGQAAAVTLLLHNQFKTADTDMPHRESGALPIHFAGHSGSIQVAERLLACRRDQLDSVWLLNGHTLFLQAVFYGHIELAEFLLRRGANTAATTVRGLGGMELAQQFQNQQMMDLIRPYDSSCEAKDSYYRSLLKQIAPINDRFVGVIEEGLKNAAQDRNIVEATLSDVRELVDAWKADVNQLGGPLQQPPLVVVVTGNNGSPPNQDVANLRYQLAEYLLEKGADPTVRERHPMAVNAVIRAAVFNHLEILRMMSRYMPQQRLSAALNEQPVVNGMTALHDTVLRATTAGADRLQGYLAQIRWCVANGARSDIEDFSGRTQRDIAYGARDPEVRQRILEALVIST